MKSESEIIGSLAAVNIPGTEKILHQMKNCVCKIEIGDVGTTGFFCKIPIINVIFLITNLRFITEECLNENKEIIVSRNDDKETLIIDLKVEREKYFSKQYGITAIEIKEKDQIKDYLEYDENIPLDNEESDDEEYEDPFKDIFEISYQEKNKYIC